MRKGLQGLWNELIIHVLTLHGTQWNALIRNLKHFQLTTKVNAEVDEHSNVVLGYNNYANAVYQ